MTRERLSRIGRVRLDLDTCVQIEHQRRRPGMGGNLHRDAAGAGRGDNRIAEASAALGPGTERRGTDDGFAQLGRGRLANRRLGAALAGSRQRRRGDARQARERDPVHLSEYKALGSCPSCRSTRSASSASPKKRPRRCTGLAPAIEWSACRAIPRGLLKRDKSRRSRRSSTPASTRSWRSNRISSSPSPTCRPTSPPS